MIRNSKGQFIKGHPGYKTWLGKKLSKEHIEKLSIGMKGRIPWNKGKTGFIGYWSGKKRTIETREKMRIANTGKKQSEATKRKRSETLKMVGHKPPTMFGKDNYMWKGDDASSDAMHKWLYRQKGKAKVCNICGKEEGKIEWCNINHTYKRKLDDYISMCTSCHRKWDIKYNNYRK